MTLAKEDVEKIKKDMLSEIDELARKNASAEEIKKAFTADLKRLIQEVQK